MSSEAQKAVENAFRFECKKDGMRQAQSGLWTLTLRVHPDDMPYGLLTAAMGTRFMVAAAEVDDDETPVEQPEKAKQTVSDIYETTNAQLAGILCNDPKFWQYLRAMDWVGTHNEKTAAIRLRALCGVESRADLDSNKAAAIDFHRIKGQFELWRSGEVA